MSDSRKPEDQQRPSQAPARFYEIVVAMDFSDLSDRALEQAIALSTHHEHSRLHVITVGASTEGAVQLPGAQRGTMHAADDVKAHVWEQVRKYKTNHGPFALDRVVVFVAVGDPAERIAGLARTVDADVIVMGTRGRHGIQRLLGASVAEQVLRAAECGVYVVHEKTRRPPEHSVPPPPPSELDVEVELASQPSALDFEVPVDVDE